MSVQRETPAVGQFWVGRKPGMVTVQILLVTAYRVLFAMQPDDKFGDLPKYTFLRRYRFSKGDV